MDKDSGQFIARNRITKAEIIAPPRTVSDIIYVYASNGKLAAYTYDAVSPSPTTAEVDDKISGQVETAVETEETSPGETVENSGNEEKKSMFGKFLDIFTGSGCEEDDEQCE